MTLIYQQYINISGVGSSVFEAAQTCGHVLSSQQELVSKVDDMRDELYVSEQYII